MILCMTYFLTACKDQSLSIEKMEEQEAVREYEGGIQSRYVAQGKEKDGNNYYVIYMKERESDYISDVESIPSLYIIDIHLKYNIKISYPLGKNERADGREHKASSFEEYKSFLKPIERDYELVSPIIDKDIVKW